MSDIWGNTAAPLIPLQYAANRPFNPWALVGVAASGPTAYMFSFAVVKLADLLLGVDRMQREMETSPRFPILALRIPAAVSCVIGIIAVRKCWLRRFEERDYGVSVIAVSMAVGHMALVCWCSLMLMIGGL